LGIECGNYYSVDSGLIGTRWHGIRFENARHRKELTQANTLYVKVRRAAHRTLPFCNLILISMPQLHKDKDQIIISVANRKQTELTIAVPHEQSVPTGLLLCQVLQYILK
jgi:hypothetical protein